MLNRILAAGALALAFSSPALAQTARVVSTCGIQNLRVNDATNLFVDATGTLCSTAGSGGGGGGGATGSVTPAGTSGTSAQAVQGITGGVPLAVAFSAAPGAQEQDVRTTQTLNAATLNAAVTVPINGQGTLGFNITGLAASGATLTFEQSEDGGTTWTVVNEVNAGTGVATSTRTTDGQSRIAAAGRTNLRFRVSAVGTGTITINTAVSVREGLVTLASPLPPGTNSIGTIGNAAFGISGTLPAFAATPTFNVGTTNGLALDTTLSGVATSNSAISTATGTTADAATASGANSTIIGALRAIRDRLLGTLTTTVSSSALPTGAATSTNQTTEITALQAIQQRAVTFSEAAGASLAASATSIGTSRDVGATPLYTKFNVIVSSTQSGTLTLQGSNDNFSTTNVSVASVSATAGAPVYLTVPVMFRYQRYVFVNGNTAAATVSINTSYTAN